jgi:O-antigen/teichoic acid export membrane protein
MYNSKSEVIMSREIREVGKKSAVIFAGNLISRPFNFIFGIAVGKLLGAEIYGEFIFIVSFLSFFVTISGAGLANGVIAFFHKQETKDSKESLSTHVIKMVLIFSLIIIFFLYLFSNTISEKLLNNPKLLTTFLMLIPTIALLSLEHVTLSVLRANERVKEMVFVRNIFIPASKLLLLLVFVLIFKMKNIYSLIIPYYIYSIVALIYIAYTLKKFDFIGKIKKEDINKEILFFSMPLLFGGMISILTTNVDQYMIGYMLSSKDVGIYKVAVQFATLSSFAYISLNTAFAPSISKLYHQGKMGELIDIYRKSTKWLTIINLFIFGIYFVAAKDLMRIVGEEFVDGATAVIIISLGEIINSGVGSVDSINIQTGHPRYSLYTKLIVLVSNVILNRLLIPSYGINGAAFATMMSIMMSNSINFLFMYRNLRIHPYDKSYYVVFLAMIVAAGTLFMIMKLINAHYLIRIGVTGIMYTLIYCVVIFRFALNKGERDMIFNRIKGIYSYIRRNNQ